MKLSARYDVALAFASRLHAGQLRKGTQIPYISHLLAVSSLVLEHGGTEDEAIAALLHDAVEDQGGASTRETIRRLFGEEVTEIVNGCTDAEVMPKPPWRERKEAYVAHVREASESVRLVSAADKLHNARSVLADLRVQGAGVWSRFTGGREGTLWYYRALVQSYRAAGDTRPIIDELDRVVSEIERIEAQEGA